MKVQFFCNSGANIHSERRQTFDTKLDLKYSDDEWSALSDDEKYELATEWANERLEIGFKEIAP